MIGTLLALLAPLLPSLIQGIEKLFAGKPKSGEDKMKAVIDALRMVIERMMAAGVPLPDGTVIPEKSISDDLLRGLIEAELQRLKASGQMTAPVSPVGELFILRGAVTAIK